MDRAVAPMLDLLRVWSCYWLRRWLPSRGELLDALLPLAGLTAKVAIRPPGK